MAPSGPWRRGGAARRVGAHCSPSRREAAIRQAEGCVKQAPQAAECHHALGVVLGAHAMSKGLMKTAGSIGTNKTALLASMKLAPQWYPARSAVVEFYLLAPCVLGGSSGKAVEAAKGAARPEQARALEALVALADERLGAAIAGLSAVAVGVGAVKRVELARPLKGAAVLPIDYRLGIALQAQGLAEPAKAALARFASASKGSGKALEDARSGWRSRVSRRAEVCTSRFNGSCYPAIRRFQRLAVRYAAGIHLSRRRVSDAAYPVGQGCPSNSRFRLHSG